MIFHIVCLEVPHADVLTTAPGLLSLIYRSEQSQQHHIHTFTSVNVLFGYRFYYQQIASHFVCLSSVFNNVSSQPDGNQIEDFDEGHSTVFWYSRAPLNGFKTHRVLLTCRTILSGSMSSQTMWLYQLTILSILKLSCVCRFELDKIHL